MILIRCDRCGKEVPQMKTLKMPLFKIEIMYDTLQGKEIIDLCDDCKQEFLDWLKGNNE